MPFPPGQVSPATRTVKSRVTHRSLSRRKFQNFRWRKLDQFERGGDVPHHDRSFRISFAVTRRALNFVVVSSHRTKTKIISGSSASHGHPPQHRRLCTSCDRTGPADGAPNAAGGRRGRQGSAWFGLCKKCWFFWRKWHPRPCCDRVEFTRHQQREITGMMDMTSELACSIPGAPKDIGAGWTDDR